MLLHSMCMVSCLGLPTFSGIRKSHDHYLDLLFLSLYWYIYGSQEPIDNVDNVNKHQENMSV